MPFNQPPPQLGNQYQDDRALRSYLARALPADVLREIEPSLLEMGELAGGELYRLQLADRLNEPRLTHWDAWGNRIDSIEVTPLWRKAERIAASRGVVATAYERTHGRYSRVHQFALAYLFTASTDLYSCPLAMTDGAACTLQRSGNQELIARAVPRLISRDPGEFWTSGQWMTESTGGSDVGRAETIARPDSNDIWRLYGRKWFTSAAASQIALTLARPEGNPAGGRGLALFYVEARDAEGRLQNISINRLKDKLGTRKLPTAELSLEGTPAKLVAGRQDGVREISPMLNLTRTWNSVSALAYMRRGLALARDYARRRVAFGAPLAEKPLYLDTLAGLQAEFEAALNLTFYVIEWIGREETEGLNGEELPLLRLLTPIVKLTTARQSVAVTSEILEAFGGAGYVEDTGLPMLLRDSQVFPIWEGATNVLALDALRAIEGGGFDKLKQEIAACVGTARDSRLMHPVKEARQALAHSEHWLEHAMQAGPPIMEAGARRFALTLGRTLALALLIRHAQWSLAQEKDGRAAAAAIRFTQSGVNLIARENLAISHALAMDDPLDNSWLP
jgi:acyl-CoA dehydrogenase